MTFSNESALLFAQYTYRKLAGALLEVLYNLIVETDLTLWKQRKVHESRIPMKSGTIPADTGLQIGGNVINMYNSNIHKSWEYIHSKLS